MTDYKSSCDVLISILNDNGYEDSDCFFEDNIYEKRINELNWRFGLEFDERRKYYNQSIKQKENNTKLRSEKQILFDKKEKLKSKNDILRQKNENLKNKNEQLKKENKLLKAKYDEIINSNSWKITEPLRKFKKNK